MKQFIAISFLVILCSLNSCTNDTLSTGFTSPPNSAKARTWWHWMNGNVTRKGITADLEAMKKVGIQEAQIFNVDLGFPQGEATYLSPEWLELFKYAAIEAQRLGLELAFHNSAGWSSSGGPWITPEYAMQTIVSSEVIIPGDKKFKGRLPQPQTRLNYYKDIAVLAFPKPISDVKIENLDFKSLSGRVRNHLFPDTLRIPITATINKSDIIDLTSRVANDGSLEWEVPTGEWVILRMGHTPTGKKNHPAVPGGHGLECDKMSKKAVDVFWEGGVQPIIEKLGPLIGSIVNNCLIDSYEVGTANWTPGFDKEFIKLRGYDSKSYLPSLAGYYIDGGEITERFLWDFRRTIGDLMAENYYSYFGELCHQNGMTFSVEPYWGPFDNMQVGATGDIVMCEFWSGGFPFFDSPKFVSSIAHLNGSSIVGAEAFTGIGGWSQHPATIKSIGDKAWAKGITRFIFHSYVHQPWDVGPGLALSYHGMEFNRLNTWWEQGKAFMDYIGRSQFLLQQGKSVADVLVFTGESSPNNALLLPEIKSLGFDYDLIGLNKLNDLSVENGKILTPVGGRYSVLMLPKTDWIRPETLHKIEQLARSGATVIGSKPKKSPSLKNYPTCDKEIKELADKLWNAKLINDNSILDFLKEGDLIPDLLINSGDNADISFFHRKTEKADIYFIANGRKESRNEQFKFRVSGKQPERWNPETGEINDLAEWQENKDGTTSISLHFESEESVFLVFRKATTLSEHIVESTTTLNKPKSLPLPNLKLIKAEYGTFLQEGLVDITSIVKNKVNEGKLNINATRQLCDCDPAMGYKKEFRMEYKLNGSIQEIYVEEREAIIIDAGEQGELKILKAVFGKFKPENKGVPKNFPTYDVTDKIEASVSSGELEILVDDSLIDGKNVVGNQQVLRISYNTDGTAYTTRIPKGKFLKLSKDIPESQIISDNGKIKWKTPYPGIMTYRTSKGKSNTVRVDSIPQHIALKGAWDMSFPLSNNVSENKKWNELISWSSSSDKNIRYFSGTATYKKQFVIPQDFLCADYSLELDLGSVQVIAEVILNGKNLGILWKTPFRLNLDGSAKEGINQLELKISNLWPNRLIGDESYAKDYDNNKKIKNWPEWILNQTRRPSERSTFASYKHWDKDSELLASGLLGPVIVRSYVNIEIIK